MTPPRPNKFVVLAPLMVFCVWGAPSAQAQPDAPPSKSPLYQRSESLRKSDENVWRTLLNLSGVKETATQDAVIALLGEQQQVLDPLRFQAHLLAKAVASPDVTDAQIGTMLQELRAALKAEQGRRAVAVTGLKTKINIAQDPHLETVLLFYGVVGDEAGILDAVPQGLFELGIKTVPDAMKALRLTDPQAQALILQYVKAQESLFKSSLEWGRTSLQYYDNVANDATDEDRRRFLTNYREQTRQLHVISQKALVKLDTRIGYTRNPRLEASLFLMGVLGDEATILTGFDTHGLTGFTRRHDVITGEEVTR